MSQVTKSRKQRLRACEKVLTEHMEEFVRVGLALKEIRDERLYKEDGFERFEDYCRKKWEISRKYADKVIASADLRIKLPTTTPTGRHEWTERAVRELKRLPADTKAKAVAARVLKEVEKGNGKLTSTIVRKHVDEALGTNRKPKPRPKIKFQDMVLRWTGQLDAMAHALDSVPDDALNLFAKENPSDTEELVSAIERVQKSLERVWAALP